MDWFDTNFFYSETIEPIGPITDIRRFPGRKPTLSAVASSASPPPLRPHLSPLSAVSRLTSDPLRHLSDFGATRSFFLSSFQLKREGKKSGGCGSSSSN